MSGVRADIWASLKTVVGATSSAAALVLALLGSFWDPGVTVRIGLIWLVVIGLVVISLVATAVRLVIGARRLAQPSPPKIVSVRLRMTAEALPSTILIIEAAPLFVVDLLVTIYHEEAVTSRPGDVVEEAIGIGQVMNVQGNGLLQVRVLKEALNHLALWERIRGRETAILQHVIMKPSIDVNAVDIKALVL